MPSSILNSDDGVISGTSGLKSTGGDDGNLNIQSNGTTVAAVSNGAFQIGGNNISADNSLGFRNRIINGDMRIDQRNAGAAITPTNGQYSVDRFMCIQSTSSKYSAQQNAGSVTPPTGFTNYLGATSLSAYSVASGDQFYFNQRIEANNLSDLGWGTASAKTVTISFWVRSSLTGTFGGSVVNAPTFNYSYPFTYTISAANTWEQKSVTIAGPTAGTWASSGTGAGMQLAFGLGVGSTFSGTAGSWSGSLFYSATGATSVVGTNGATFYITGVQLEVGSVATPFERRPYGTELSLCQRYFEVGGIVIQGNLVIGGNFSIPKRAIPTMVRTGNFYASASTGSVITAVGGTVGPSTGNVGGVSYYSESGGNGWSGGTWTASAEL